MCHQQRKLCLSKRFIERFVSLHQNRGTTSMLKWNYTQHVIFAQFTTYTALFDEIVHQAFKFYLQLIFFLCGEINTIIVQA